MKTYRGWREGGQCFVQVNYGDELPLRLDLANHSPTGFDWGYAGSGPAQLALAILAYDLNDELAFAHYEEFKFEVIAKLKHEWLLTSFDIREFLETRTADQSA